MAKRPKMAPAEAPTGGRTANHKSMTNVEKTPKAKAGRGGLPHTYFGNSDACGTERGNK